MTHLTQQEVELVALGAAVGSNCVPCVEYHIQEAKKAGLTDSQIRSAVELADKVRQVPARKVFDAAMQAIGNGIDSGDDTNECADISGAGKRCC